MEGDVPEKASETCLRGLRMILEECDARIMSAESDAAARQICEKCHESVAEALNAWRAEEKVSFEAVRLLLKKAFDGLEVAVPAPPLPMDVEKQKKTAECEPAERAPAREAAATQAATDFRWFFLSSNSDVISVLQARSAY